VTKGHAWGKPAWPMTQNLLRKSSFRTFHIDSI